MSVCQELDDDGVGIYSGMGTCLDEYSIPCSNNSRLSINQLIVLGFVNSTLIEALCGK